MNTYSDTAVLEFTNKQQTKGYSGEVKSNIDIHIQRLNILLDGV